MHSEEAGGQGPGGRCSASVQATLRRGWANQFMVCWSVAFKIYYFYIKKKKEGKTDSKCFLYHITIPAFLYWCGINSSWTSPGHPVCLLSVGGVVVQGRGKVRVDGGGQSISFLVCWITSAFRSRLLCCCFHFSSSDLRVSCAVCHLNNNKKPTPKQQKSPRLTQEATKLFLKNMLQHKIPVWGVQIFVGTNSFSWRGPQEVVLSSPLLTAGSHSLGCSGPYSCEFCLYARTEIT